MFANITMHELSERLWLGICHRRSDKQCYDVIGRDLRSVYCF